MEPYFFVLLQLKSISEKHFIKKISQKLRGIVSGRRILQGIFYKERFPMYLDLKYFHRYDL